MTKKTLKALRGSIQKWEKIVEGTGVDQGVYNCPLCQLFYRLDCKGCPVFERTGYPFCDKTPYREWEDDCTPELKKLAQAEVDFLKSLLPKEE